MCIMYVCFIYYIFSHTVNKVTQSHQSILIHIGPLDLLGVAACQDHGAPQHVEVLLTKQKEKRDRLRQQNNQLHQAKGRMGAQTNGSECFYRVSERASATRRIRNSERGSAVSGTRRTHLGVNPYSTDGTDLKIVTWQSDREKRERERKGGSM